MNRFDSYGDTVLRPPDQLANQCSLN